ncbi:unnamed protein product [Scytosiphon promiscuus]
MGGSPERNPMTLLTSRASWLVVVLALSCFFVRKGCAVEANTGSNGREGLMWSSRPLTTCQLEESGVWIDVPDTKLEVVLARDVTSLISYSMVVVAAKPQLPGSSFLGEQLTNGGSKDFLQVRLVVNGLPMRQSAASTSPAGPYESYADTLSGHLAMEFGQGNHSVGLQWKKTPGGIVTSWRNRPSAHDGFAGGRSIVVTAQHRYMWYSTEGYTDVRTEETETWDEIPGLRLNFELPEPASIRILYSISVMPDQNFVSDAIQAAEDVSARLVVDGIPYRESIGSHAVLTVQLNSGMLERDLVLSLQAGEHTVAVEWRKRGSTIRAWRNSPSLLDGFAASRFVVAMGERFDVVSQHFLTPIVLKDPFNEWHTVGGRQLEFYLHGPATVLFTYGLPVTQYGHPTFDSWSWERWSSIQARLLVDGVPYRHSASQLDGSERIVGELRGLLAVSLAAGSHTAALQWKAESVDGSIPWYVLNGVGGFFQGGEELLVLVNAENNQPKVILPSGPFTVNEDEHIFISGARVSDIDMDISKNYELAVRLSVEEGLVSLNGTNGLGFSVGDGVEDGLMYFHGPASSIGDALGSIRYRGRLNWFGNDTLTLTINDQMYLGAGEAKSDTKKVVVLVLPVPDVPEIALPTSPAVKEDGRILLSGLGMYDADVSGPGAEGLLFDVWLEAVAGCLSLNGSTGLLLKTGRGLADRFVAFTGRLADINAAVDLLTYVPDQDFNSGQHAEILTVGIWQTGSTEAKVAGTLPIFVGAVNDPPTIATPHHHVAKLGAFRIWDRHFHTQTRTSTMAGNLTIGISTDTPSGKITLQGMDVGRVPFQVGAGAMYGTEQWLTGSAEDLSAALAQAQLIYSRSPGYDGADVFQICAGRCRCRHGERHIQVYLLCRDGA